MNFTPEILGDELWHTIYRAVVTYKPDVIVEIGSANGLGSTTAFIAGIKESNNKSATLVCFELDKDRHIELTRNLSAVSITSMAIRNTTVPIEWYMSDDDIVRLMTDDTCPINTKKYGVETVLGWKKQEIAKIENNTAGLQIYSGQADMVLIDGSEFTAEPELLLVWGARVIILDDICSIKNWRNYNRLATSKTYRLIAENKNVRNGYAAFERIA